MKVTVSYAKAHLSRLLKMVQLGEEVLIARAGRPVAKLVLLPAFIPEVPQPRVPGSAKGMFEMPDDFDASLPPEIEDTFWR